MYAATTKGCCIKFPVAIPGNNLNYSPLTGQGLNFHCLYQNKSNEPLSVHNLYDSLYKLLFSMDEETVSLQPSTHNNTEVFSARHIVNISTLSSTFSYSLRSFRARQIRK